MTEEQLEQSKLIKLIQRVSKKSSNPETKALAQKVLDNAAAATKAAKAKPQNDSVPASPQIPNGSISSIPARPISQAPLPSRADAVAGVKRPLEGASSALPATKKPLPKPIVQASKPLAVQQAERRKAELAKQSVAKNSKPAINSASAAPAARPKVIPVIAKPTSSGAFAGLLSASKRPGTTIAEKAAAAKAKPLVAATTKKESSPQVSVPAKPAFSFLDAFQSMDKPKEVEKRQVAAPANETDEERRKRLRREQRAHLRVSWADKLTDVRLFTHDPDEDIGHADSMRRDVGDVGSEGRMLKMHLGAEDIEDDEGEELDAYHSPSEVDFSDLDWEERKGHFVKTGGPEHPESKASEAQRLHEDSSLMVVYALPSDQPSSPKEPPETEDDYEPDLASSFGEPPELVREKEKQWLAARPQERPTPGAQSGQIDINAILRSMQQQQQQQQTQTQPPQIPTGLQQTLALFGQQQPHQTVAAPQPDLSSILAVVNQMKNIQQPPPHQQPQPLPPNLNVTAIMQALAVSRTQEAPLPVNSHPHPNPYNERKHPRSDPANDSEHKRSRIAAGTDVPYNYKTQICSFWQKGTCTKGDACTYRHSE